MIASQSQVRASLCTFHPSQTRIPERARPSLGHAPHACLALSGALLRLRTGHGHLGGRRLPEGRERAGPAQPAAACALAAAAFASAAQPTIVAALAPPARRLRLHHRVQTRRRHPRHHQVNFKENLPIESLTSKGNVLMVSLPGAFTPT